MAAYVVVVPEADWAAVAKYINALGEGGILVPQTLSDEFERKYGQKVPEGQPIDYTFDPPDVMVELPDSLSDYSFDYIRDHLGIEEAADATGSD